MQSYQGHDISIFLELEGSGDDCVSASECGVQYAQHNGRQTETAATGGTATPHDSSLLQDRKWRRALHSTEAFWSDTYTVGANFNGQLGDGTNEQQLYPVQTMQSYTVSSSCSGKYHTVFVISDGSTYGTGRNLNGQLGNNNTDNTNIPVRIMSNHTVFFAACGGDHTFFVSNLGQVFATGKNNYGQLGNGLTEDTATPVEVLSGHLVISLAAGWYHTVFLTDEGLVFATGKNDKGQLGTADSKTVSEPVKVPFDTDVNVTQVICGGQHSIFLTQEGAVWATGYNKYGQLGDGTQTSRLSSVVVHELNTSVVVQASAGSYHSLFLNADGRVHGTGRNNYGQLGEGSTEDRLLPVLMNTSSVEAPVQLVVAGGYHSVVLDATWRAHLCGRNNYGQLAQGSTTSTSNLEPALVLQSMNGTSCGMYHSVFTPVAPLPTPPPPASPPPLPPAPLWAGGSNSTALITTSNYSLGYFEAALREPYVSTILLNASFSLRRDLPQLANCTLWVEGICSSDLCTIDGVDQYAFFHLEASNLTVVSLRLQRGWAASGAAVRMSGGHFLILRGSELGNHTAYTGSGGAVFVEAHGARVQVDRSSLCFNVAYHDGGALYISGDAVNLTTMRSTVEHNSAKVRRVSTVLRCMLRIERQTLYGDHSSAKVDDFIRQIIAAMRDDLDAEIDVFVRSSSLRRWARGVKVQAGWPSKPEVHEGSRGSPSFGGALFVQSSEAHILLSNSSFSDNQASKYGGAAYFTTETLPIAELLVEGCVLRGNNGLYGTAMYVDDTLVIDFVDTLFEFNHGGDYGGAIYIQNSHVHTLFTDLTLSSCVAQFNSAQYKGAVVRLASGSQMRITIRDTLMQGNMVESRYEGDYSVGGSAIAIDLNTYQMDIVDSKFVNNTCLYSSGTIELITSGDADITIHVTRAYFEGNHANSGGGAIHFDSAEADQRDVRLVLINCTLHRNTASALMVDAFNPDGGALRLINIAELEVHGCTFSSNSAFNGGAIAIYGSIPTSVAIVASRLLNNTSAEAGGALYVDSLKIALSLSDHSEAAFNVAQVNGGFLAMMCCGATLALANVSVTSNTGKSGGGLWLDSVSATVSGCHLASNKAQLEGGAMYGSMAEISLVRATLSENQALSLAGGLYMVGSVVAMWQTNLTSNRARGAGGAAYISGSSRVSMWEGCLLEGNYGSGSGGGLFLQDSELDLREGALVANVAKQSGGGLFMLESPTVLHRTVLRDNVAGIFGGGIYSSSDEPLSGECAWDCMGAGSLGGGLMLHSTRAQLTRVAVRACSSELDGGGLSATRHSEVRVEEGLWQGNVAKGSGGGALLNASAVAWTGCNLTENRALFGGALAGFGVKDGVIRGCTVANNSADEGAGVLLMDGCNFSLASVVLHSNRAERGAGIHVSSKASATEMRDSWLEGNTAYEGAGIYLDKPTNASHVLMAGLNFSGSSYGSNIFWAHHTGADLQIPECWECHVESSQQLLQSSAVHFALSSASHILTTGESLTSSSGAALQPISFYVLDYYGNLVGTPGMETQPYVLVSLQAEASVSGETVALYGSTGAVFDQLVVTGQPGQTFAITFVPELQEWATVSVDLGLEPCAGGTRYNAAAGLCEACAAGYLKLDNSTAPCTSCEGSGLECPGGSQYFLKPGHWMASNAVQSSCSRSDTDCLFKFIYACDLEENCDPNAARGNGGNRTYVLTDELCAGGYRGDSALCGGCQGGHELLETGECKKCDEEGSRWVQTTLILLVIALVAWYSSRVLYKRLAQPNIRLTVLARQHVNARKNLRADGLVGVMVGQAQVVGQQLIIYDYRVIPPLYKDFLRLFRVFDISPFTWLGVQCFFIVGTDDTFRGATGMHVFYISFAMYALLPYLTLLPIMLAVGRVLYSTAAATWRSSLRISDGAGPDTMLHGSRPAPSNSIMMVHTAGQPLIKDPSTPRMLSGSCVVLNPLSSEVQHLGSEADGASNAMTPSAELPMPMRHKHVAGMAAAEQASPHPLPPRAVRFADVDDVERESQPDEMGHIDEPHSSRSDSGSDDSGDATDERDPPYPTTTQARRLPLSVNARPGEKPVEWYRTKLFSIYCVVATFVLMYIHPGVSSYCFQIFSCDEVYLETDETTAWLRLDRSVQCFTTEWYAWMTLSIAVILTFSLGLPIGLVVSTVWLQGRKKVHVRGQADRFVHHSQLRMVEGSEDFPMYEMQDPILGLVDVEPCFQQGAWERSIADMETQLNDSRMALFITPYVAPYKSELYYWMGYEILMKLAQTSMVILVQMVTEENYDLVYAMMITLVAIMVHTFVQPYKSNLVNFFQMMALATQMLTLLGYITEKFISDGDLESSVTGIILISAQVVFSALLCYYISLDVVPYIRQQSADLVHYTSVCAHQIMQKGLLQLKRRMKAIR
ncbi:hypothetical protein CYMTET_45542 [Cymbomonas tetramitiformis]|uniref:RCC1-like domain-containing protein n=1 Tax=Cymbomonas tetramitiformis TaxID=36881 RepID=A0AAE0EXY6_9CHLO|nr:hypothetical protein CYMTET_45542 [Cymbomonas tetramitiformis]